MLKSRSFLRVAIAFVLTASLAACSGPPAPVTYAAPAAVPVTAPAPATTVVNAAPASHGTDMLVGGVAGAAAGYMLANAQNKAVAPPAHDPTVVQQTVIHKTVNVQHSPPPVAPPSPKAAPTKMAFAPHTPSTAVPSYRSSVTSVSSTASYRSPTSPAVAMRSYTPSASPSMSSRR